MRLDRFRCALLSGVSRDAVVTGLPYLHILTLETIMLRVGLKFGFIHVGGDYADQQSNGSRLA